MKKGGKFERVRENKRKLQDVRKMKIRKLEKRRWEKEKKEKEIKQRKQEKYRGGRIQRKAGHEMEGRTIFKFEMESFRRKQSSL